MIIDSGASVNVLDKTTFERLNELNSSNNAIKLATSRAKLFSYGSVAPLPVLGKFDAIVTIPAVSNDVAPPIPAQFIVVDTTNSGCLLGKSTAIALGLLKVGPIPGPDLNCKSPQHEIDSILVSIQQCSVCVYAST
mgnify:CR=1 FL=1